MANYLSAADAPRGRGLTLITCTGARPQAFALCEQWMSRQTLWSSGSPVQAGIPEPQARNHGIQWLVVDDGPEPTEVTLGQTVIRPQPRWQPGENTLPRNLRAALAIATGRKILFIEDDDWYGPEYLETMCAALDRAPLAGEIPARYYNVVTRQHFEPANARHASLCQTGIRAELVPMLEKLATDHEKFIDLAFYRQARAHGHSLVLVNSRHSVGIKGLPGRAGIGIGHRPRVHWPADPDLDVLRRWLGGDAAAYADFYHGADPGAEAQT